MPKSVIFNDISKVLFLYSHKLPLLKQARKYPFGNSIIFLIEQFWLWGVFKTCKLFIFFCSKFNLKKEINFSALIEAFSKLFSFGIPIEISFNNFILCLSKNSNDIYSFYFSYFSKFLFKSSIVFF